MKVLLFLLLPLCLLPGCIRTPLPEPQLLRLPTLTLPPKEVTPPPLPTAERLPQIMPTAEAVPSQPALLLYTVPVLSQEGLFLNGIPTGVGCVPVCIEMMTAYWHTQSESYPLLSAQDVIDKNAEQGLYAAGRGMTSASAEDELADLGYAYAMTLNADKETLLQALADHGPVGVLVKTEWVPTTMNHSVVLTGYEPENDTVILNDPYYGTELRWNWEAFDGIWGLNYAGDTDYSGTVVQRVFFSIFPMNSITSSD